MRQDLLDAFRSIRATPWLSTATIALLAVGTCSLASFYLILNALALRPLPVPHPNQLVSLSANPARQSYWSFHFWKELQQRRYFDGFAWGFLSAALRSGEHFSTVNVMCASGEMWTSLQLYPELGASFGIDRESTRVAVVSHRLWRDRLGSSPLSENLHIELNGARFAILGVLPRQFVGPEVGKEADVVVPLEAEPFLRGDGNSFLAQPTFFWLNIMGRIVGGQSVADVRSALARDQLEIREATQPSTFTAAQARRYLAQPITVVPAATGISSLRTKYAIAIRVVGILGVVVFGLTCLSIGLVSHARVATRRPQWQIRFALGCSRIRLARSLILENCLLATAGVGLAVLLATITSRLVIREFDARLVMTIDWRVVVFGIGLVALTTLVLSAVPVAGSAWVARWPTAAMNGRATIFITRFSRVATLLVQVAASTVLVTVAAVFCRSNVLLNLKELGIAPDKVVIARFDVASVSPDGKERVRVLRRLLATARELPGSEVAAVSALVPLSNSRWQWEFEVSHVDGTVIQTPDVHVNVVGDSWFRTYGTRILVGQDFTPADVDSRQPVVVVNQAFVEKFLPGSDAVGATIAPMSPVTASRKLTIVGVAEDSVYETPRDERIATVFVPLTQYTGSLGWAHVSVRSKAADNAFASALAKTLTEAEPRLIVETILLREQIRRLSAQERVLAALTGVAGATGILLASLGILGVAAHQFHCRRRELCIRLALGATPGGLLCRRLLQQSILIGVGASLGIWATILSINYVRHLLYGPPPTEPFLLAACWFLAMGIGLGSEWIPLRKTRNVDLRELVR